VNPVFNHVIASDQELQLIEATLTNGQILSITQPLNNYDDKNGEPIVAGIYTFFNGQTPGYWPGIRSNHKIINTGDMQILPSFTLTNQSNFNTLVTLTNTTNSTSFTYILGYRASPDLKETLTFNGYTKILSSDLDANPYAS
jgi:hypothetical protein